MSSESPYNPSSRAENGWLPSNTSSSNERAATAGGASSGQSEGASGLWAARGSEASAAPLPAAARPTPPYAAVPAGAAPGAAPAASGGRRTFSALLAAVLVAGTVGGAAGSVLTANALSRGPAQVAPLAAPVVAGQNFAVVDPASVKAVYKQVAPSVVAVQTAAAVNQARSSRGSRIPGVPPNLPGQDSGRLVPLGEGTGFVVDTAGHIITNNHVVDGASAVSVVLSDGTRVNAQVVGRAPDSDLALLKADIPANKMAAVTLGDSDAVEPGDLAVAIGTPFGLEQTLTAGIVSAVNRDFGQAAGRPQRGMIQTDAAINPGNSGGPLFNAQGQVIGVTTAIESPVQANVGVGFAIPSNTVKRLLPQLIAGQTVQHAYIGISGVALDADVARDAGLPAGVTEGVLVASVSQDGPAARAGIKGGTAGSGTTPGAQARGGDVIVAIDGQAIKRVQDLSAYLDGKNPGDTVTVAVVRNGTRQDVKVTLAPWPSSQG
jgi:S1-C subfamily serine protease